MLFSRMARARVRIRFSVWLVSCYCEVTLVIIDTLIVHFWFFLILHVFTKQNVFLFYRDFKLLLR